MSGEKAANRFFFIQDNILFSVLLITTLLLKMLTPANVFNLFLILTLFFFFLSKKNWFWIAYLSVITFDVGGIFGVYYSGYYLNIFLSMPYFFWFAITALLKVLFRNYKFVNRNYFKKPALIWLAYFVFLSAYGVIEFGKSGYFTGRTGLRFEYDIIRFLVTFTFFFSLPRLLSSYDELIKFSRIIFILVFISLFGQIYNILTGMPLNIILNQLPTIQMEFLDPILSNQALNNPLNMVRAEWGANIRLIALLMALIFFIIKENTFNKKFLALVIIVIIFSTFITATRGWIIAFVFIIFATFISMRYKAIFLVIAIVGIFSFGALYEISTTVQIQTDQVVSRLSTLKNLAEGDLTAGGTNSRLTERSVPVMNLFYEHPVLGVGLSGIGMKVGDGHVGNQTILMGEGIIGLFLFLYFIFYVYRRINRISLQLTAQNKFYNSLFVLNAVLIGLVIIHSTSSAFFGLINMAQTPGKIVFLALIFTLFNVIINSAAMLNHTFQNNLNNQVIIATEYQSTDMLTS